MLRNRNDSHGSVALGGVFDSVRGSSCFPAVIESDKQVASINHEAIANKWRAATVLIVLGTMNLLRYVIGDGKFRYDRIRPGRATVNPSSAGVLSSNSRQYVRVDNCVTVTGKSNNHDLIIGFLCRFVKHTRRTR